MCAAAQEWIPDSVWLNVVALSSMTALHDIPDSVFRNDGLWRQWYDAEAPETANVPDYEDRLSKFERMCVVKVCLLYTDAAVLSLQTIQQQLKRLV